MDFDYKDFRDAGFYMPDLFGAIDYVVPDEFSKLQDEYDEDGHSVLIALWELRRRTTSDYFREVFRAQTKALGYSKKVFPTYKFILPDTLADDWLSTVDWHKKYPTRDHSLHQVQTAYIVAKLLGNGKECDSLQISDNENLLSYCSEQILKGDKMLYFRNYAKSIGVEYDRLPLVIQKKWAKDVFYETAVISALFHDMGYPWQYVNRLSKSIRVAEYGDSMNIVCNALKTKESIQNRLLIYPFYGYSETNIRHASVKMENEANDLIERGLKNTHGLPGALGFMCLNDKIKRFSQIPSFREASYRLIIDWAAVGIMMHDMPSLYWGNKKEEKRPKNPILRLSFDKDPLSSIISMADILEEFYRPSASFNRVGKGNNEAVGLKYKFPCQGSSVFVKDKTLYIRYRYEDNTNASINKKRRQDEVNEYFNIDNGYIDLSSLGIWGVDCDTEVV